MTPLISKIVFSIFVVAAYVVGAMLALFFLYYVGIALILFAGSIYNGFKMLVTEGLAKGEKHSTSDEPSPLVDPTLGLTMADGGHPTEKDEEQKDEKS